jgi:hypothetical protein
VTTSLPSERLESASLAYEPPHTAEYTDKTCAHCGGPQIGFSSVFDSGGHRRPLCHPSRGMDCYRLVIIYGHEMPCDCRGASDDPDSDVCYRCQYRRGEHLVEQVSSQRFDFLGNLVPCQSFLETPAHARFLLRHLSASLD